MTTTTKTPAEIEALKEDWLGDPCWDLELAEGFEAHHDELLAFRLETEAREEAEDRAKLGALAEKYGCPGNLDLARTIRHLVSRIAELEGRFRNP